VYLAQQTYGHTNNFKYMRSPLLSWDLTCFFHHSLLPSRHLAGIYMHEQLANAFRTSCQIDLSISGISL
jgi:hypothetical protein